jgi:protein translocase SecG subunit
MPPVKLKNDKKRIHYTYLSRVRQLTKDISWRFILVAKRENYAILFEMQLLGSNLPYIQIVLSVLLITAVLLQRSSAGLGGAFGESSNFSSFFHARRGAEKFLFNTTIILGILFALTAFANLLIQ